jgi:hypothetical protein
LRLIPNSQQIEDTFVGLRNLFDDFEKSFNLLQDDLNELKNRRAVDGKQYDTHKFESQRLRFREKIKQRIHT